MRLYALAIAISMSAMLSGVAPVHAQKGAKNACPGEFAACVERCTKVGGQTRRCPTFAASQKGC